MNEAAQRSLAQKPLHGQEVSVPAAVVKGGEQYPPRRGEPDQRSNFSRVNGHWFIHDDVLAGLQNLPGYLEMAPAGCGNDKEAKRRVFQHRLQRSIRRDARIALGGLIRMPLDHGGHFKSIDR